MTECNEEPDYQKTADESESVETGYRLPMKSIQEFLDAEKVDSIKVGSELHGDMRELWQQRLLTNQDTDALVIIGKDVIECHSILLKVHSKYFAHYSTRCIFTFLPKRVPAAGFRQAYDWMRATNYALSSEHVVEMLQVAKVLRIAALEQNCYALLNHQLFYDCIAYQAFQKAHRYSRLYDARILLVSRIHRYFLTFVGSPSFKDVSVNELVAVISSESCAVNSECEIFYAILRWVNFDAELRAKYLERLMALVRFGYMSVQFLSELVACFDIEDLRAVVQNNPALHEFCKLPSLKKLCQTAITFLVLRLEHQQDFRSICAKYGIKVWEPRAWICDESCKYHLATREFPCPHDFSFMNFIDYVAELQMQPHEHIETFKSDMSDKLPFYGIVSAEDVEHIKSEEQTEEKSCGITRPILKVKTSKG